MIENHVELMVAVRQLRIMEAALRALRTQLEAQNPELLAISALAYTNRIASLQSDISRYLCDHPTEVSLIVKPWDLLNDGPAVQAVHG
jgi:hypothetical protein